MVYQRQASTSGDRLFGRQAAHVCAKTVAILGKRALPRLVQVEPPRRLAPFSAERSVAVDYGGIGQASVGDQSARYERTETAAGIGSNSPDNPVSSASSRAAALRGVSPGSTVPPGGTQPRTRCRTRRTSRKDGWVTQTSAASGGIGA